MGYVTKGKEMTSLKLHSQGRVMSNGLQLEKLLDESIHLKEMLDLEVAKLLLKMAINEAGWRKDAMAIEIECSSKSRATPMG
jgi:hypothetical protein